MALAYESGAGGQSSFNNSFTLAYTMPSVTDGALCASFGTREANDITGVTYNSDALTVAKLQENDGVCAVYQWYMVAPDAGSFNLVGTADEFNLWDCWVNGLSGVDQSTPIANTGGTNTFNDAPSTTISTGVAAGDLAIDVIHTQNTRTVTTDGSQTEVYNHDHTDANQGMTVVSYEALTGTSIVMSASLSSADNWAQAVTVFKAAAGGDDHTLVTQDSALALTMDATTITQNHVVASQDSSLALSIDNATITQNHIIQPQDISLGLSTDNTTVNHNHVLPVQDIALALSEDSTTITQNHVVASQDIALSLTEDNTTVANTNHFLAVNDIALALTEDNTTVDNTDHFLVVNDILLSLTEDNTSVSVTEPDLVVNDIAIGLSLDNTTINQNHVLVPADVALALTEDATTIAQGHNLTVQDIALDLSTDNATITQNHIIASNDLALALLLDVATILRYDVVIVPGDDVTSGVWVPGNDPNSATHSVGDSVGAAVFTPSSIGSTTIDAGNGVGGVTWVPGDQV